MFPVIPSSFKLLPIASVCLALAACGGGDDASTTTDTGAASIESTATAETNATADRATIAAAKTTKGTATTTATYTWTKVADEWGTFTVSGSQRVRYGAGTKWIEKTVSGTVACKSDFFGSDPAPGVVKQCELRQTVTEPAPTPTPPASSSQWVKVADEWANFSVTGTKRARYGAGTKWLEKDVSGSVACKSDTFGSDPAPGVVKQCDVQQTTTTPPPSPDPAPTPSPTPDPDPAPAPGGAVTAKIQATRVSGTAPLAVQFDATGTTSTTSGLDTFRQITYAYNFGDERGQTWAVSGKPKNTETGGPLAAHVFDVPGTYTVKVKATDPNGATSEATVTVTVQDPATVYAGTKTVCVSPAANYSGCPSGATQQTSYPSTWNGKRVLLHRGESFGGLQILDGNSGVQVGTYGSGAKPVVASVGVGNWRPNTSAFATDITVMDLNVQNGMQQSIGSRVLFYRNDVRVTGGDLAMTMGQFDYWYRGDSYRVVPQSAFYNAREIFFVENYAVNADTSSASTGVWGDGSRVALLGNTYGKQQMHSVRFSALHKGVIAHNEIQGISADGIRHALKLHSSGLNPYADGSINDTSGQGGWATNQVVIANNLFGNANDNNAWTVAISPQNDQYAEGVENVIIENNRFARGKSTSTDLVMGGRLITSRGNTTTSGAAITTGIGHDGALPAAWKGPYYYK